MDDVVPEAYKSTAIQPGNEKLGKESLSLSFNKKKLYFPKKGANNMNNLMHLSARKGGEKNVLE